MIFIDALWVIWFVWCVFWAIFGCRESGTAMPIGFLIFTVSAVTGPIFIFVLRFILLKFFKG